MKRTIEDQLLNPKPGSKAAAAREFGVDLTLLLRQLRLTPEERARELQGAMRSLAKAKLGLKKDEHLPTW